MPVRPVTGFGGKQILEVLVLGRHKRFGSDNAGIREIPGGDDGVVEENAYFHVRPPKLRTSPKTPIKDVECSIFRIDSLLWI